MTNQLAGFASLPADTFAEGSPAGGNDGEGNPIDANGRTGPFDGQPVQGFSGVQFAPDNSGAFWFLSDNGFGAQDNSTDYLLRIYQVDPNFSGAENGDGSVEVQGFVQLSDPDNLIPFDIVNQDSEERLLTGGDFDIESFVIDDSGDIWVGEEFGPYLLHFNSDGELIEAPISTPNITNLNTLNGQDPLIIGHRGASGILPEHTLEAYATAIAQGADFIEPDLVITKDGVLIARHEPMLDDTTNVAEVFGEERMSTKLLDGEEVTAYFAEDFTLEEIKMLRAVQSRPYRAQDFNEAFEIPTLEEVIQLVQETEAETGIQVGIYPETKHPTFFDEQGLSLEEPLVQTLQDTGFTESDRIFIQSFEVSNLIDLSHQLTEAGLPEISLVQLFGDTEGDFINEGGGGFSVPYDFVANFGNAEFTKEHAINTYGEELLTALGIIGEDGSYHPDVASEITYGDFANPEVIEIISSYASGLGPWKNNILLRESLDEPVDGDGDGEAEITSQLTGEVFPLIDYAHDAGLQVHPYTHRNEERFLTLEADGTPQTPESEIEQLIDVGVDGFFTDFPATGVAVVDSITGEFVQSPQNPDLGDGIPNLSGSRGFEGMAFSPDRKTLYPLLEGTVDGDPANALRIYEFDVESASYTGLVGYYPTTDSNPIGDFTPINDTEFLVIERDNNQGEEAEFKKVFKIDISQVDENGFVAKEEVVDLLNIPDPDDLNGDDETSYSMPFVTIEDVVVIDEDTILVANDNNYPFSQGREGDIDNNEIVLIDLEQPLNLDPTLGQEPMTDTSTPETTLAQVDSGTTSVFLDLPLLESAAGITLVGADSEGTPFSDDFQVGFSITEDTDFTYEIEPFAPVAGTIEHSGTITLNLSGTEVTVGEFSIGFDAARVSETASGFFVADTTDDALNLEVLFDVGAPGNVAADSESLTVSGSDLLVSPELAEALETSELAGADVGDTRIDATATIMPEMDAPKNVIMIVGDGMGWEMVRAAAIARLIDEGHQGNTLEDFYTEGRGEGLSFQELEGYTHATTYSTIIDGDKGNSAFEGDPSERVTGEGELREGFTLPGDSDEGSTGFNPTFNPYADENSPGEGNLVGYDPQQGGTQPWLNGSNPDYIKQNYTDSAAAGTSLYSGVKTFAGALGVDIFEQPVETILETAQEQGMATGTVSSVPFSHATPAAPASHVNNRGKLDDGIPEGALEGGEFDIGDSVTQQMLLETQPDLILGGGHPLDYNNTDSEIGGELEFRYIAESTYEELRHNPDGDNLYGYNFLERNPNAGEALLDAAAELSPEDGDRLFGLYGARGQNGNLPLVTADGDYSNTGLDTFSHRSSQMEGETPDLNRPLMSDETVEDFIATEADENPTLAEMTEASLEFLSKDEDGFFLSVEQGDMDWVLHDNNMDNLLGTFRDIDETVQVTIDWIEENGGWEENLLIVTADHDHYMTLTDDFPALYREYGGEALTTAFDSSTAGHYFGSDPEDKYQWGSHSNRPVPVYYQGAGSEVLDGFIGQGFESYGVEVPGIPDHVDLVHLAQTARTAILNDGASDDDEVNVISGAGGRDILTGADGKDLFVLGDENGSLYSSSGLDDYAEITHFVPGEDSIQLAGSIEDYSILVNDGMNVAIALDTDGDGAFDLADDEFIALVGSGFETADLVFV
ncbi:MAG: esterase-like activity of phytase family protein [Cyanobacteria bacterium P01_G01_bin.19]